MAEPSSPFLPMLIAWGQHQVDQHLRVVAPFPTDILEKLGPTDSWPTDLREGLVNHVFPYSVLSMDWSLTLLDVVTLTLGAIKTDSQRQAGLRFLKALLEIGANPNRFNGQVTPVGYAGYSYQADVLALFESHGADLAVSLAPEHAGRSGLALTTLLHRMGQRFHPRHLRKHPQAQATIERLARARGSIQVDENGFTVINDPLVDPWFRQQVAGQLTPIPSQP